MKKLIDYLMIFAALILLGVGCQSEEIPPVGEDERNVSEGRTFSLTASMPVESGSTSSMPEESGSTRIAFTQEGISVALTWEVGDQLDLLFVQGSTQVKQTVTVKNISADGKRADFEFTVPDGIEGTFNLYGVYGGGGLSDSDPSLAVLPMITGSAPSLESLAEGKNFMMVFSQMDLNTTSPQASVTFHHLGSLFCLTLKSASTAALTDLGRAELVSTGSGWAYNSGTEPHYYNLVNDTFQDPASAGSFITLYGDDEKIINNNDTLNFWGWYPPLPDVTWPELMLRLYDKNNILIGESGNVKWGRTSQPGNCYHLYAVKNDVGAGLHFTDHTYAGVFDADGNYYSTVVIGDQEWFTGNLKTTRYNDGTAIPNVTDNAAWASLTTDAYVWYANDEATYKNAYGALYNGYAVNTGNLCPAGWHVPSDAEWTTLINYAGGADVAGGKLKSKRTSPDDAHPRWTSPNTAATDAYGFSALPGGRRYADYGYFGNVGFSGQWWSSTEAGATYAWVRNVSYANGSVSRNYYNKRDGFSVRCLRDN